MNHVQEGKRGRKEEAARADGQVRPCPTYVCPAATCLDRRFVSRCLSYTSSVPMSCSSRAACSARRTQSVLGQRPWPCPPSPPLLPSLTLRPLLSPSLSRSCSFQAPPPTSPLPARLGARPSRPSPRWSLLLRLLQAADSPPTSSRMADLPLSSAPPCRSLLCRGRRPAGADRPNGRDQFDTSSAPYASWQRFGKEVLTMKPKGLVVVSAHWESERSDGAGVLGPCPSPPRFLCVFLWIENEG